MTEIPRKDAGNSELYYTPYGSKDFQKTAQEVKLDSDVRTWPAAILQEFAASKPFAFQVTSPEIEFERIDEQTGNAFGAIVLRKPYQVTGLASPQERLEVEPEKVAVPVVIENFSLKPFEVFIRGDKVIPLTEGRFAESQAGSSVANGMDPYFQPSPLFLDKMIPPTVGYLGNLYGNYSLSGGEGDYSSWVPAKGAQEIFEPKFEKQGGSADTSKEHNFLSTIKSTIRNSDWEEFRTRCGDERAICGYELNKTLNIVKDILGTKPTSFDDYIDFIERAAPVHLVWLCRKSNGKWCASETNDYFYKPVVKEMTSEEVVARYLDLEPRLPTIMASTDEVILEAPGRANVKPVILEDHEVVAEPITQDGHYYAVTKDGGIVEGQVFSRVLDYNGAKYPATLFMGVGGHSLQDSISGERLGDMWPGLRDGSLEVGAEGAFVGEDEKGPMAFLPVRVTNVGRVSGYQVAQGVGISNERVAFVLMPGVTRLVNATGIADPLIGSQIAGNVYFIPPGFKFVPMGKKLHLESDPRQIKNLLSRKFFFSPDRNPDPFDVETSAKGNTRSLRVISGQHGFTLKGAILESMRRDAELQDLSATEVHHILAVLGVPLSEGARITAMAIGRGEVNVTNLRPARAMVKKDQLMDKNLAELAAAFRRNLFKEASTIGDPKAVDAMLSLNFVNEANLMDFLNNLPMFREVEEKLAELYLYTLLGLKSQIPENAVLSAMKSLNEVNEHLEYLMSMLQMPASQAQAQAAV